MSDKTSIDRLGEELVEALGSPLDAERRTAQELAVVQLAQRTPRRGVLLGRPRRWALVGAFAGVAAVVVTLLLMDTRLPVTQAPVTQRSFRVQGHSGAGKVGMWLSSRPGHPVQLDFAGGSRFVLQPRGLAQVAEASRSRVTLRLDHGRLDSEVRRKQSASWHVTAGPYRVTVQGTRFSVVWDAQRTLLRVIVTRGQVLVTGTGVGGRNSIVVKARRELRINRRKGEFSLKSLEHHAATPATKPAPTGAPTTSTPDEPAPQIDLAPTGAKPTNVKRPAPRPAPRTPAWRAALKAGRYAAAVAAAEKHGFSKLKTTLAAKDLWRLARACRYARKGRRATEAFRAYRTRFAGSGRARLAAFLLGRVHLELRNRPAASSRWFATYLRESPRGPLAEEALGHYINASSRAGRTASAVSAAKRYLARYKTGMFRKLAQSVLRRSGMR